METKQISKYVLSLSFGLINKSLTTDKYQDKQTIEFKELMSRYDQSILNYLSELEDNIVYDVQSQPNRYDWIDKTSKRGIRMIKTRINDTTSELNSKFISSLMEEMQKDFYFKINDNVKRVFNIKFYLLFYESINKAMIEALKGLV